MKRPSWAGESESACRATVSSSVSATSVTGIVVTIYRRCSPKQRLDAASRSASMHRRSSAVLPNGFMGRVAMRCNANLGSLQGVGPLPLAALTTTPTATCLLSAKLSANQPAQWQTRATVHTLQALHTAAFPGRFCPDTEALARPKRDSRSDINAVTSVDVQEAPFAPWQAPQRCHESFAGFS